MLEGVDEGLPFIAAHSKSTTSPASTQSVIKPEEASILHTYK
jgi:hypothetical protein